MDLFVQRHIRVVQAWAAEEPALGVPELPQSFSTKESGIEIRASLARIGLGKEFALGLVRLICVPGGAYRCVTDQRLVVILTYGNRETG